MAVGNTSMVFQHLRRIVRPPDDEGLTDGQLLERFLTSHQEDAFAVLVQRHAQMVLGVCRRVLKNSHDAEDAFQATFLVLSRKAASLSSRQTVGNWLYGVAYHTALKARAASLRRRDKERQSAAMNPQESLTEPGSREALLLLDQEVHRLPEKYRAPVVLCDLEGKTHREAAQELGWPQGTVAGRLFRAREMLARRLRRHGLVLSAGSLAALLTESTAPACVPPVLIHTTIQTATLFAVGQAATVSIPVTALTEGVLQAMLLNKIKLVTVILLTIGVVSTGAGVALHRALADKPAAQADSAKPKVPAKEKPKEPGQKEEGELAAMLQSVDAAKNTLTVFAKRFGPKTFDVAKDAKILLHDGTGGKLDFKEGKLSDLSQGLPVTLKFSPDRKEVVGIWAEGPSVHGTLKAVDPARRTLTVTIPGKKDETERTFEVAKEALVAIHDGKKREKGAAVEQSTLADLPVGAVVTLKLSVDQKVVANIQAEGAEIHGVVKAVDKDKNSITVTSKEGERTFAIPAEVPISIGETKGKRSPPPSFKLTDVPVGAQVAVRLTPDQKTVMSLRVEGTSVGGTVKAVDAGKKQITLTVFVRKGEAGEDKPFDVAPDALVRIDGKEGTLADVPVGASVRLKLSVDQKAVSSIEADGEGLAGVVKAVDGASGSITLGNKAGEQTLTVGKDAPIFIDGKPGKLNEVPADSTAKARLSADQKTILSLSVAGPSIHGTLKSVDADKKTITLSMRISKTEFEDKTFTLAPDVQVATGINGVPLKLADLKGEKEIALELSADQKAVRRVIVVGE